MNTNVSPKDVSSSKLIIIVAYSANRVIGDGTGKNGKIPWRIRDDMRRFKDITMGHPIIMGRGTHESIGNDLPGRENIVLSRDISYVPSVGSIAARSIGEALQIARESDGSDKIFFTGGGMLYQQALYYAARIIATEVLARIKGDVYFPALDPDMWLVESSGETHPASEEEKASHPYRYVDYVRVR